MIGNAHLDPVWLWQWQEGFQEAKATFRSALDRMRESDDFLFTSSSAAIYEWVEQNDRGMFEEIKQRVAEGRWEIVGGWWIQPDCNLPGGESFVRQGLYGQRYFREKFGVTATVGYNVDSFGHHAMLPQILKKSGLDYYVFMRPQPHEKGLPGRLFYWESDDASRVLAFRIPYEYCTPPTDLQQHVQRCATQVRSPFDESMCFYGVGNHGGGPTKENLSSIRALNEDPTMPALLFSTPDRFFRDIDQETLPIPVVHDELQMHAVGCYAAHSGVKRWNRKAETLLVTAEKFSSIAEHVTGQLYPDDLSRAWKNVLFNQFHDILAGTSIEPAYEDARDSYGEAKSIAGRALNYALQSISWQIEIPQEDGTTPIVVFNPHSWPVRTDVELEFGRLPENASLRDDERCSVPMQTVQSLATVRGGRNRISFMADLPPVGYRVYTVGPGDPEQEVTAVVADDTSLENDWFRLEINPATGCISSLWDKARQHEVLGGEGAQQLVLSDPSDTWSHGVFRYDDVVGSFAPKSVRLVENGPVKSVLRVTSEYGKSVLVQDFTMYGSRERIDVHVTVDWGEQFKILKLRFPLNLRSTTATYEIPYGHIERPANGEEVSGQSWIDLTGVLRGRGDLYGLSILNDGKYSFAARECELDLTVLRSPIYAHHDPRVPEPEGRYTFLDQGVQRFSYSLVPHAGSWEGAGTVRQAAELNQPPIAIIEAYHVGPLPLRDSYLCVDQDNVIVSAVKKSEDNDDLILRCYETEGRATAATIRLPRWGRTIETSFGSCEIKTFRVPKDGNAPVAETNLLEWSADGA